MRSHWIAAVAGLVGLAATSASAQHRLQTPEPRYGITETDDGYLRLDRETGEVSQCRRVGENWDCTVAADERQAMQAELEDLRAERQALRIENERLRNSLRDLALRADRAAAAPEETAAEHPSGEPPATRQLADRDEDGSFTDEAKRDIDQALDVTRYAVRRLFDTYRDLEGELFEQR